MMVVTSKMLGQGLCLIVRKALSGPWILLKYEAVGPTGPCTGVTRPRIWALVLFKGLQGHPHQHPRW